MHAAIKANMVKELEGLEMKIEVDKNRGMSDILLISSSGAM